MPFKPQAFIFDAYGTLFDVHSVGPAGAGQHPGDLQALSQSLETEATRIHLVAIAHGALRGLLGGHPSRLAFGRHASFKSKRAMRNLIDLMQAYLRPQAFPEVISGFGCPEGHPNGNSLERFAQDARIALVRHNGLDRLFYRNHFRGPS